MELDSALGQQVRRLEQMVGTPLLSRQRDGVRLTAAGVEVIWLEAPLDAEFSMILGGHSLTATAAVVWSRDLPRHLQQVLFDTADAGVAPECDG